MITEFFVLNWAESTTIEWDEKLFITKMPAAASDIQNSPPFYFFFLIIGKKYQIKRELFSHSLISIIGFVLNKILKSPKPFKIWSFFSYYLFHSYYRITFRFLRAQPGIWEENCEHLFIRKRSYNFRIFLSLLNTLEDKGRPKID